MGITGVNRASTIRNDYINHHQRIAFWNQQGNSIKLEEQPPEGFFVTRIVATPRSSFSATMISLTD